MAQCIFFLAAAAVVAAASAENAPTALAQQRPQHQEHALSVNSGTGRPGAAAIGAVLGADSGGSSVGGACPTVELVWQPPYTQVNRTAFPDAGVHGVEDGIVVRRADGGLQMIAAEMYADPVWVAMRLGVYTSHDGMAWSRVRALRNSTADNRDGSDPHAAHWGPFFVHDPRNDSWVLSYVAYRSAPSNSSGWLENFQGTIFARWAAEPGDEGLDADFGEAAAGGALPAAHADTLVIAPDDFHVDGPWPHVCQASE